MTDETAGPQSVEWRRTLVVSGIRKFQEADVSPDVQALAGVLALAEPDLMEELEALQAEGVVVEHEGGKLTVDGAEPVTRIPPPPVSPPDEEARRRVVEDELPDDQIPEAIAPTAPVAPVAEVERPSVGPLLARHETTEMVGDVRITRGMATSLSDEALGALVKAGLGELPTGVAFTLRIV